MYEYVSKFPVRKLQNADSAPAAEHIMNQRFATFSSKSKSSGDMSFLDEKIHERIFGKPDKTYILDESKNGSETLLKISHGDANANYASDKPAQMHSLSCEQGMDIRKRSVALQRTETSDTLPRETSETTVPRQAVVQRALDTKGLNPRKHSNIIEARNLWNVVFEELFSILPSTQQADFQKAVNEYENENLADSFAIPNDENYAAMTSDFVEKITAYLRTRSSTGSMTAAALAAGGSVHVVKDTGGHTNTQTRIAISTVRGVEFFDTGETREHGKQTTRKKQHKQKREKSDTEGALLIEQKSIAAKVGKVCQCLKENEMEGSAAVLEKFMKDFG